MQGGAGRAASPATATSSAAADSRCQGPTSGAPGAGVSEIEEEDPTGDSCISSSVARYLFEHSTPFRRLLQRRHADIPSSEAAPWRMILYTDEVTPGNVLGVQPRRKSQCVYISFFEFGASVLANEDAWLTIAICRSSIIRSADGGVAQLVGQILALVLPELSTTGLF